MKHGIHRVTRFEIRGPYALYVEFDDGTNRLIDFRPVLEGDLYGPLQEIERHDWPRVVDDLVAMARRWRDGERKHGTG